MDNRALTGIRTALMVMGFVFLVVFGARAASQASDMKLAGGRTTRMVSIGRVINTVLGLHTGSTVMVGTWQPMGMISASAQPISQMTNIASTPSSVGADNHAPNGGHSTSTNAPHTHASAEHGKSQLHKIEATTKAPDKVLPQQVNKLKDSVQQNVEHVQGTTDSTLKTTVDSVQQALQPTSNQHLN